MRKSSVKIICKKFFVGIFIFYVIFETCLFFTVLPFAELLDHPAGLAVLDQQNELAGLYTNIQGNYFIPLQNEISPEIRAGILSAEDRFFYQHIGVNILAIFRASFQNILSLRRISGASTISMQLIRMKMNNSRTWFSKMVEAWYALKLERVYSKEEILKAYLNNAPFGANIYGLETASLYYFSKPVADLRISESTLLLGLPQSPSRLRPDRFMEKANFRKNRILNRMVQDNLLSQEAYVLYANQVPALKIHKNIFMDHGVLQKINIDCGPGFLKSSLDKGLHRNLVKIVKNYQEQFEINSQIAISVIAVETGQVLALFDSGIGDDSPFISCALSSRSSGSCLKPFIYAKAFDLGLAWPEQMVRDTAINIHGFQPRNNDYLHYQNISISDALRLSRNIPAIELLQKIGGSKFEATLNQMQISKNHEVYLSGLTVAIGGVSVDLLSLTNAYALFARDGLFKPYTWLYRINEGCHEMQIYQPSSIEKLKKCLLYNDAHQFYAKTGTSWGPRDVWCVGFDDKYSIGVWIGNKEGGSMSEATGESLAYPLLSRIFAFVSGSNKIQTAAIELGVVRICSQTGYLATNYCQDTRKALHIGSSLVASLCQVHLNDTSNDVNQKFSILSPVENAQYGLMRSRSDLVIECRTTEKLANLFWFINGRFKGRFSTFQLATSDLQVGENVIAATHANGFSARVVFFVTYLD